MLRSPKLLWVRQSYCRFLYVINIDADDLKTGSRVLHERGYVEFANVVLSDERLVNFDLR